MNFKGESRFDAALVADAGANPASSTIWRELHSGLRLARVTEGHTGKSTGCSDLSPSSNLMGCVTVRKDVVALKVDSVCAPPICQSVPNTPMNVGKPWATIGRAANLPNGSMHGFHAVGTTDEEIAGRWTNIPDGDYLFGGSGATLWAVSLRKPAIEKEARLRSQPHFILGSGETRMQMRKNSVVLGATGF